jgi:hypothetical protein
MDRLPENPTKAQELEHLRSFLALLPRGSYLAGMLQGAADLAELWMSQDVGFELLPALRAANEETLRETNEGTLRLTRLREDLRDEERKRARILREYAEIRVACDSLISSLADLSRSAASLKRDANDRILDAHQNAR